MRALSAELAADVGLIPLAQAEGDAPTVHCVHAVSGSPLTYLPLASRLGGRFAVTGVQSVGLSPGRPPQERVLAMAGSYAAAITAEGPSAEGVLLCGWSMGGLIAFEMAGILLGRGIPVRVAMIDTQFPVRGDEELDEKGFLRWFARDVGSTLGVAELAEPPSFADMSVTDGLAWLAGALGMGKPGDRGRWVEDLRQRLAVFTANVRAIDAYRPVRTPVDVFAVHASRSPVVPSEWEPVVGGRLRVKRLDGDHYSLVQPPTVDAVADLVAEHFRS
jgi:thioesterase domain-containing protein